MRNSFCFLTVLLVFLLAVAACSSVETVSPPTASVVAPVSPSPVKTLPPQNVLPSTVPGTPRPSPSFTVTSSPPTFPDRTFPPPPQITTTTPTLTPTVTPCDLPVFTVSPIEVSKIAEIITLGNLNPPGHTFPTDHIYFYPTRPPGNPDRPDVVNVYAPADLTVTNVVASRHVQANITDFNITFQPCRSLTVVFGHVSSLNTAVFGPTMDLSGWELLNEYSTGGETYRISSRNFNITVKAGDLLGTAGGNPGQWALDFGVYNANSRSALAANPSRWQYSNYLTAVCPLSLYPPGPLLDNLVALVKRDKVAGEPYPWGTVMQDVAGTASGCWFFSGTEDTYPEDPHLALVHSNLHPSKAVFSVGTSVPSLKSGVYEFTPQASGLLNRDFKDVVPDDRIYGFSVGGFSGVVILSLPDADTLYLEVLPGGSTSPSAWKFSNHKVVFQR